MIAYLSRYKSYTVEFTVRYIMYMYYRFEQIKIETKSYPLAGFVPTTLAIRASLPTVTTKFLVSFNVNV